MKNRKKSQVKQETRNSSVDSVKKQVCAHSDLAFLGYNNTFSFNVLKCFEIYV